MRRLHFPATGEPRPQVTFLNVIKIELKDAHRVQPYYKIEYQIEIALKYENTFAVIFIRLPLSWYICFLL